MCECVYDVWVQMCLYVCVYVCIYVYVCVCVRCVYVCICVYIYVYVLCVSALPPIGAFTDVIRKMDDPNKPKICQLSAGIHIILPSYYSPRSMGMLDPETTDGRVIFFLPWEGRVCVWVWSCVT